MISYKKLDTLILNKYPKDGRKKNADYQFECDDIFCFDIEVSSAWINEQNEIIQYTPHKTETFWNEKIPLALPYIWQFSINDIVYYGREIQDFENILRLFPKDTHIIIWVHNLGYEFDFLNNFLMPWQSVFANIPHHPIKCISEKYPQIEFRCSYMLTRLSLDAWGKDLGFEKLHTLDYYKIRTPKTVLKPLELNYCERDCLVMYKGLIKYRDKYKHLVNIPLTQTGEIRRVVKKIMKINPKTNKAEPKRLHRYVKMLPENAEEYAILKQVFAGGYTHANFLYVGIVLKNLQCYDFSSSYPYVMCSEKFPMQKFYEDRFDENLIEDYAFLIKITYKNIKSCTFNHYISKSKCINIKIYDNVECVDNGRIIQAEELTIYITEVDFEIIKQTYVYDSYKIKQCYKSHKTYLPKKLIEFILQLYNNKCALKNVCGKEEIYLQSKQFINSIFGMSVTDVLQDELSVDEIGQWNCTVKTIDMINNYLAELHENPKGRVFMAFSWGLYVTSYARKNLWTCLLPNDINVAYCDTDSLKIIGQANFDWYNKIVLEKLTKMCEHYNIDINLARPYDKKGTQHTLGFFEREWDYTEFITLGAKRYCYRSAEDNELHITISGINKDAVRVLKNDINNFTNNTKFDKDANGVHKMLMSHLTNIPSITWRKGHYDEYNSNLQFGINGRPTSYNMSLTHEFLDLIELDDKDHLKALKEIEV